MLQPNTSASWATLSPSAIALLSSRSSSTNVRSHSFRTDRSGWIEAVAFAPVPFTVADLRRWEDNGATWRLLEAGDRQVVVELCTCYGEAVEVVEAAPDLLKLFRSGALGQQSE